MERLASIDDDMQLRTTSWLSRTLTTSSQAHVISSVVDLMCAFLRPEGLRKRLTNFVLGHARRKDHARRSHRKRLRQGGHLRRGSARDGGKWELVGQYEDRPSPVRVRPRVQFGCKRRFHWRSCDPPWQNGKPEGYGQATR